MEAKNTWIRWTYYAGNLILGGFFILSILFYQERIAFLDAAFYLFEMARTGTGAIFHDRFLSLATQWLPLAAIKMSLSLETVAILYSVSFPLFFAACYWACGALRDYGLALCLLLYLCLFTSHNFYWHLSELTLGTALIFPITAYVRRYQGRRLGTSLILLLGIPTIAFAHPLVIFPFLFAWIFFYRFSQAPISRIWFWSAIGYYLLVLLVKHLFFKEAYESQAFGGLKNFFTMFPRYDRAVSMKRFLINIPEFYYFVPLIYGVLLAFYLPRKRYLDLGLVTCFLAGYGLLIMVSYPHPETEDFYLENLYLPLAFFLALPWVFHWLPRFRNPRIPMALVMAIWLGSLIRVWGLAGLYQDRTDFQKEILAQYGEAKYIIDTEYLPADRLYMPWATPYEFWFLSTVEHGVSASLLITHDTEPFHYAEGQRSAMVTTWGSFEYDDLPSPYFRFPDREKGYLILQGRP